LEVVRNLVKIRLDNTKIYLPYKLKSPWKIYYPEELFENQGDIHAKFPQGLIIDHLERDGKNLIINREWALDFTGQLNLSFNLLFNLDPSFYLIPSVIVNGNKFGKGK